MDRRQALAKLGLGAATAAGASLIVSTPAFASPGTPDDVATAVFGQVRVLRTGSNRPTQATLTNVVVICPQGGPGVFDDVVWSNGGVGLSTSFPTPNGSGTYSHQVSFVARCSDRNGFDVCAAYTGQFTYSVSGNVVNTTVNLTTLTLAYRVCPP
jgi:hypothetical protein